MKEEDLINILNQTDKIEIQLEGIINTKLIIENVKASLQTDKIEVTNQNKENNYIAFDRHQLMKIEENEKELRLLFDQLQTAIVKISKKAYLF